MYFAKDEVIELSDNKKYLVLTLITLILSIIFLIVWNIFRNSI